MGMIATGVNIKEVVQLLVEKRANLDKLNFTRGDSPLHCAAYKGYSKLRGEEMGVFGVEKGGSRPQHPVKSRKWTPKAGGELNKLSFWTVKMDPQAWWRVEKPWLFGPKIRWKEALWTPQPGRVAGGSLDPTWRVLVEKGPPVSSFWVLPKKSG